MARALKVLGQVAPAATTLTTLYTVPASTSTVCSSLLIANAGATGSFRIAVRPAGESIAAKHYIAYDHPLQANGIVEMTCGITLATTDVISVYGSHANYAFSAFGSEIT